MTADTTSGTVVGALIPRWSVHEGPLLVDTIEGERVEVWHIHGDVALYDVGSRVLLIDVPPPPGSDLHDRLVAISIHALLGASDDC